MDEWERLIGDLEHLNEKASLASTRGRRLACGSCGCNAHSICGAAAPCLQDALLQEYGRGQGQRGRRTEERKALLLHGTTRIRSENILRSRAFAAQRLFFAYGWSNRDLARLFAQRVNSRSPQEGGPALVVVSVPEQTIQRLRQLRVFRSIPFDPEDRPALRGRRQWILEPGGVEILNRHIEEWRVVPLRLSPVQGR
jgi:hypothetical protein